MKRLIFSIAFIVLIMTLSGLSRAMVTGECSNCHTVHNSQHGNDMQTGYAESSSAKANLLRANNCLGCHASSENTWDGVGGAPIVYNVSEPNYGENDEGLAAGNFYYTTTASGASGATSRGHSLDCVGSTDDTTPLSDQRASCGSGCHMPDGLSTNGCESCHFPAHHKGTSYGGWTDADTGYYRFLGPVPDPDGGATGHLWGIRGYEDNDWQKSTTSINHNEYSGEEKTTDYFSISHFCAGCHYESSEPVNCKYFSTGDSTYHKANMILPADYTNWDGYRESGDSDSPGDYHPLLPIARKNITSYTSPSNIVVYNANDTLMCLSCHRAHASPYDKMLRWDYVGSAWIDLPDESCKGCHSTD